MERGGDSMVFFTARGPFQLKTSSARSDSAGRRSCCLQQVVREPRPAVDSDVPSCRQAALGLARERVRDRDCVARAVTPLCVLGGEVAGGGGAGAAPACCVGGWGSSPPPPAWIRDHSRERVKGCECACCDKRVFVLAPSAGHD